MPSNNYPAVLPETLAFILSNSMEKAQQSTVPGSVTNINNTINIYSSANLVRQ